MRSTTPEIRASFRGAQQSPLELIRDGFQEIWSRRRLARYLVQADLTKKGSDTLLGNIWWVLDPLLQMVVYVVLVEIIFHVGTPDYPLFIFAAILPWKWFTSSIGDAIAAVTSQERLIKQVHFPKIVLPVATATAGVVGFAWGLIPLGLIMLFYIDRLTPLVLWIPVIAVVQHVLTIGFAILVSAANVFFRDLGNVLRHFLRLWFNLSPGLYSLQMLEQSDVFAQYPVLLQILKLSPFATLFEAFRAVIYGTPEGHPALPDFGALAALTVASFVLIAIGSVIFKRLEPMYAKVL